MNKNYNFEKKVYLINFQLTRICIVFIKYAAIILKYIIKIFEKQYLEVKIPEKEGNICKTKYVFPSKNV